MKSLKPYPAYKDSGVPWLGEVPAHWEATPLGRVLIQRKEKNNPIKTTDILSLSLKTGVIPYTEKEAGGNKAKEDLSAYMLAYPGDIVVNSMNVVVGSVGLSKYFGAVSPVYYMLRPRYEKDLVEYFDRIFQNVSFQRSLFGIGNGIMFIESKSSGKLNTIRLRIPMAKLKKAILPWPPAAEQASIVRFLDHADRRIQRYIRAKQKLMALLGEQRKNATQEAIQSPSTTRHRLEAVADLVKRPIERVSNNRYTPIGLYNRGRGIFRKEPRSGNDLGDSDFFWVEEGDLVISGQFAWEGAVALASDAERGCVASHRYPILRGKPKVLDSGFLLAFFQTGWGQLLLDHHSRGAAGRNRPLNARTLMKEKIPLPPLQSQLRIVEMLRRESRVRQQTKNWNELLNEYRTRLIADIVTGKLDVREAAARLPDGEAEPKQFDTAEALIDAADAER